MSLSHQSLSGKLATPSESLSTQCDTIVTLCDESNDIVQAGRNILKKIRFNEKDCVIKVFREPSFPQNFSYGLFAKSKAKKSYLNSTKLIELGFRSPTPVGYFEYRSGGRLTRSYYLCEFATDTRTLQNIINDGAPLEEDLIQQFAKYSYALHDRGILHRDFNAKNILIGEKDGIYSFDLVDVNRITWYSKLSLAQSMHSLSRLPFTHSTKETLLTHYIKFATADLEKCLMLLNRSEAKTQRYFRNKKRLRKIFPKRKK